ncbi:MAG: aminopeptidase P family protein [Candidatus Paracaedibacteraceae bacterium]|nr:aminopeptidase P family protein [Candidatus Paracaedibacteraceae bacterium]
MSAIYSLQQRLKDLSLDCFIVPRSDRYQGEYVVEADERLAWLTGFTGSAGTALVFQDHVALFVDGRYTLQAAQEVTDPQVKIIPIADQSPYAYVSAKSKMTLGFDPWLMSIKDQSRWQALPQLSLIPIENPIDSLWEDHPSRPLDTIVVHDEIYAGQSLPEKLGLIYEELEKLNTEALLVMAPDNLCWALNCRGTDFPFTPLVDWFGIIVKGKGVHVFCDSAKASPSVLLHFGSRVHLHAVDQLPDVITQIKSIILDPDLTPTYIQDLLKEKATLKSDPITSLKACKSQVELSGIRMAHLRDGVALTKFLCWLETQKPEDHTEITVADKLEAFRQENDLYQGASFPTISGYAEHGAIVHYRATETSAYQLGSGLLLVDSGGQYLDGTTDVTRTITLDEPTIEQKTNYTLVLKGHITLAMSQFPTGTTGSQLDVLARFHLWQHGLDYDHGTGHGVGHYLNVHEGPQRISKAGNNVALKPGMLISNEPGYYKAGAYGIRIENLVAVQRTNESYERDMLCFETLTLAPMDRRLIDETMLTSAEWQWLNAYHIKVRESLLPHLDPDTAAWLVDATAEL